MQEHFLLQGDCNIVVFRVTYYLLVCLTYNTQESTIINSYHQRPFNKKTLNCQQLLLNCSADCGRSELFPDVFCVVCESYSNRGQLTIHLL